MAGKIEKWLETTYNIIVVFAFSALVLLVLAQVYTRYLTTNSLTWSEELSRFLMIWLVFLGSVHLYKNDGHIWVENFVDLLPQKIKMLVLICADLAVISFFGIIASGALALLPTTHTQYSPALNIPMSYVYSIVPLSMIFSLLIAAKNLFSKIAYLSKGA